MPVIVGISIAAMIIAKIVSTLGSKNGTDKLSIMNTRNDSVANTLMNVPTIVPMMVASSDSPRTMCSNLFCVNPMTRSVANSRLRSFAEIEKAMETAAMATIKKNTAITQTMILKELAVAITVSNKSLRGITWMLSNFS